MTTSTPLKRGSPEYMQWLAKEVAELDAKLNAYAPTAEELERESRTRQCVATFVPKPTETPKPDGK
jgi:hypothetical protein